MRGGLDGVDAPGREPGPLIFHVEPLAPLVTGVVPGKGVYSLPRQDRDTITTRQRVTLTSRTTETVRVECRWGMDPQEVNPGTNKIPDIPGHFRHIREPCYRWQGPSADNSTRCRDAADAVAQVALQIADELTRGRRKSGPAPMA